VTTNLDSAPETENIDPDVTGIDPDADGRPTDSDAESKADDTGHEGAPPEAALPEPATQLAAPAADIPRTGGMQSRSNPAVAKVRKHLVGNTGWMISQLIEGMDEHTAPETLAQVRAISDHMTVLLGELGLHGAGRGPKKRRGANMMQTSVAYAGGGESYEGEGASYGNPGYLDHETQGVQFMTDIVSVIDSFRASSSLPDLVNAAAAAKQGDMPDLAEDLEKRARKAMEKTDASNVTNKDAAKRILGALTSGKMSGMVQQVSSGMVPIGAPLPPFPDGDLSDDDLGYASDGMEEA